MKSIPSYGKILNLGSAFTENAFVGEVIIQEKVDGCFDYSTGIILSNGKSESIGKIVQNKLPLEVLSYNKKTNRIEPKKITNWFKYNVKNGEFIDIFINGKISSRKTKLTVTKNHKIYTPNGYVM